MSLLIKILSVTITTTFLFSCKTDVKKDIGELKLEKNCAYIVLKGSKGKIFSNISKFNIKQKKASHVALGILDSNQLKLYHITTSKNDSGNNFYVQNINDFLGKDTSLLYFAIYRLYLSSNEFQLLRSNIKNNKIYEYDFEFLDSNNRYYCSEFVVEMIRRSSTRYRFVKTKFYVNDIIGLMTKDNFLTIFPIDFIEQIKDASLIYEWER